LHALANVDRAFIDVEDERGLPPGKQAELFAPFSPRGADRTGLGLTISLHQPAGCLGARWSVERSRSAR
jgi:nitrogen-specific signal transduction histidine kinase